MTIIRETLDLLNEDKSQKRIELVKIPYGMTGLQPVMSKATMDLHYGRLYKGYVTRFNDRSGDTVFNEAGAYLHELFFAQFKAPSGSNRPSGRILDLILEHWDNVVEFKKALRVDSQRFTGSGWIYLAKNGKLRTIQLHQKRNDIVLLIDLWEHAYQLQYGGNKEKYVDSLWRIYNWPLITARM